MADVAFVTEALHNLVIASVWASMMHPGLDDETIKSGILLQEDLLRPKAADRFYPGFGSRSAKRSGNFRGLISRTSLAVCARYGFTIPTVLVMTHESVHREGG